MKKTIVTGILRGMMTDKKARSDKAVGDGADVMVLRAVIAEQPWM